MVKRVKVHPKDNPAFLLARNIAKKGRKRPAKASTPEAVTQELTEQYLGRLGLPYVRIPAYVLRAAFGYRPGASGADLGAMREASAYIKGLPDLIVLDANGRALPIELKTDTGKLTAAQRMWRTAIGTKTARSFEEAKAMIDAWRSPLPAEGAAKPQQDPRTLPVTPTQPKE